MSLYCLVYTSISSKKMSDGDLKNLLNKSRAKNATLNITGMLLYLDPFFIQVLEGEEDAIIERFNIIKQDSNHHKVSLIYKKPADRRNFPDWTMGFKKMSDEDVAEIEGFSDFLHRPASEMFNDSSREIEKLLDMFRHETLF